MFDRKIINVKEGEENCPADALMKDFRTRCIGNNKYPKNIEFSESCINFFREMADIVEETENNIIFKWNEIKEEEDLPPLIVKIRISNGKYYLQFLKELGEEKTIISAKQRKGKNKKGKIYLNKGEGSER